MTNTSLRVENTKNEYGKARMTVIKIASMIKGSMLVMAATMMSACGDGSGGSGGAAQVSVPNVVGDTQAAATTALANAGLTVGMVTHASSAAVTNGNVISETPAAGSSEASGTAVALAISTGPAALNLSGTAAVGLPIVGATVTVVCSGLNTTSQTQTDSSGAWQISIPGASPPCALELTGGTIDGLSNTTAYHSIATSPGTTNITPLTDLMVANVAGTASLQTWFAALSGSSSTITSITASQVSQAFAVLGQDIPVLVSAIANPITTSFTPTTGNSMDSALTALAAALSATGVSYPVLLGNLATNTTPIAGLSSTINAFYSATVTPPTNSGSGSFTVGGTVTGLPGDLTIFLWNGNDTLAISSNGPFVFPSTLSSGATYAVNDAVPIFSGQVPDLVGESCTLTNGSGTITTANVSNVTVSCSTYQLNPLTTNQYWGMLAYDPNINLGVLSYDYPTLATAQTQAQLTCTQDSGSCGNVSMLTLGQCAAVASRPLTGQKPTQPQYTWASGVSSSSLNGGNTLTLVQALQSAQSQALQNCSSPPISTAPQTSPPAALAACTLVVSGCIDGTSTAGVLVGGGTGSGESVPTQFSTSFTASGTDVSGTQATDTGTFTGPIAPEPDVSPETYSLSGAMSFDSTLFGSQTFSDTFPQTTVVFVQAVAGISVGAGSIIATDTTSSFGIQCTGIVWNSGPFAGQSGSMSVGTGTFSELGNVSNQEYTLNGTCTVTLQ